MRQRRLRLNPDVYARIGVKVKNYLTVDQAKEVEAIVDRMIGIEPRQ